MQRRLCDGEGDRVHKFKGPLRKVSAALASAILISSAFCARASGSYFDDTDKASIIINMQQTAMLAGKRYNSLCTYVDAVAQSDGYGNGPAYLLNGQTNAGAWYQIGITYNWMGFMGRGFSALVQVYKYKDVGVARGLEMYTATPIYPSKSGSAGEVKMTWPGISNGDAVRLSMSIEDKKVVMNVDDISSGSSAQVRYNSFGAKYFVGLAGSHKYAQTFSGPMTEWWSAQGSSLNGKPVTYTPCEYSNEKAALGTSETAYDQSTTPVKMLSYVQYEHLPIFANTSPSPSHGSYATILNVAGITSKYDENGIFTTGNLGYAPVTSQMDNSKMKVIQQNDITQIIELKR